MNSKSIFTSVTFWGLLLSVVSPLLARVGFTLPDDTAGFANELVSLVSAAVALYGRVRATQPLHIISPAASGAGSQSGFAKVELLVAIAFASLLVACAGAPQTPAQAVYQVESDYAAALTIAVKYKALPVCNDAAPQVLCSKPSIVATLQRADDAAYAALSEAQTLVRTPGIGADKLQTAISIAASALRVMTSVTVALVVK